MIAYPGYYNLPNWDIVYLILENKIDFKGYYPDCDYMNLKDIVMWWAKKELKINKKLVDYIGNNEKTKIIIKLSTKN